MEITTFSRLLNQILQENELNLTGLYKELYDLGLNITYASLYAYYTGAVIPPIEIAREILKTEKIRVSNENLEEILKFSKKIKKEDRDDDEKILNLNLKIKPYLVSEEYQNNAKKLKSVIEMRADELLGGESKVTQLSASGKRKLSAYVAYLIKKDLEENSYITGGGN